MKTVVMANQKGGVGKTACVVSLAFYFLRQNKKVAVLDMDPQGNASYTIQGLSDTLLESASFFFEKAIPQDPLDGNLILIKSDSRLLDKKDLSGLDILQANIKILENLGVDVLLIDTPPTLGNGLVLSLLVADYVLSPIELETYSLQGIGLMLKLIKNLTSKNLKLQFLGMVVNKYDARNPRHKKNLEEVNKRWPDLIFNEKLGLRTSIAESLATQTPVWESKKTAARNSTKEILALGKAVAKKINILE